MLIGFVRSLPFLLIRVILVVAEGATLFYGSIFVHDKFALFMSQYHSGLFLSLVSLMGWLVGLGVSALIVKYVFGIVQYYFKLAQIICLTMIILEYYPTGSSPVFRSLKHASKNFTFLAINDFTTRGVVKALEALKNAILNTDLLSKFKDSDKFLLRFVKLLCTTALKNVINMTDEIIVSYTWFTNELFLDSRRRKKKPAPSMKMKVKNQALFILEGMAFTVRVLPHLLISSIVYEVTFLFLAIGSSIGIVIALGSYLGFSLVYILAALILFRTIIHIFYYVIIYSLRLNVYIYSFYAELNELEPFNINETLGNLLGAVPLLGALVKKSGQDIEPTGSEGNSILEGDLNSLLRDNIQGVASAFNLNTEEILDTSEQEISATEIQNDVDGQDDLIEDSQPTVEPNQESEPEQGSVSDIISEDEIEMDFNDADDLFNNNTRVENQRG